MSQLKFKRFSDLAFLQSIDKPARFAPLLAPFADYFNRHGLDVARMKNDETTERKLLEIFTRPNEEMPGDLLEVLYVLDDLADESGHDRIHSEIERSREPIPGLNGNLTPGDYAIAVYTAKPSLVQACHEKTVHRKTCNYAEFQSVNGARLKFTEAKKRKPALEASLAEWFETRHRGRACEIYAYEEGPEIRFIVTHGQLYRSEGSFNKDMRKSRVAYRPQRHDSVRYDVRTGILKVSAGTPPEREQYRRRFGEALFDSADHFPGGDIYTLVPMQSPAFELSITGGVAQAHLCEIWVQIDDDQSILQITKGYDLLKSAKTRSRPNMTEGQIVRAAFNVKYSSGGRARRLEVRPPNFAKCDHDRDGVAAEAFLRANHFIKGQPAHGDGSN